MNPVVAAIIADPEKWAAALVAILTPFGLACAWIWGQHVSRVKARAVEMDSVRERLADCEAGRRVMRSEITELRGSVRALTALLKREANLG